MQALIGSPDVDLLFGQRRRRWTNSKSAVGQSLVFARMLINNKK